MKFAFGFLTCCFLVVIASLVFAPEYAYEIVDEIIDWLSGNSHSTIIVVPGDNSEGGVIEEPIEIQIETSAPADETHESEKNHWKGWLSAQDSKTWLRNNHFQVRKNPDGNGYIIFCNYYDSGPPSTRYNTRTAISGRGMASISGPTSALATIDENGQLRVAPSGT